MAHLVENMAYAGELPWHGLGKAVSPDLTPAEFLEEAGLDWKVVKHPMMYQHDGVMMPSKDVALVRDSDGRQLTTISGNWHPVQNVDAYNFFHEFVSAGDMEMHTGGSLKDGQIVWALARVKSGFSLFGGDEVESFLLFSNSHEYGRGIDIRFTPTRVVCHNTLTLSLREKSEMSVKLSHRKAFDPNMVKETLGIASKKLNDYREMAEFLGSKKANAKDVIGYFAQLFPHAGAAANDEPSELKLSLPAKTVLSALHTQPGTEFAEGSWWQAFNAVTYATDHLLGRSTETRLSSAWYGLNRIKKVRALELAVDYAEAA